MKIVRIVLLLVHLGTLFLLLGVLLNAYVPPKVFPWFNLISLGFPLLISIYCILTVLWIFMWKKRAFVFMFFGLFFLSATQRWINFTTEKEGANLKIVSFNIKGGRANQEEIEGFINRQNADLVLLQEDGNIDFNFSPLKRAHNTPIITLYTKKDNEVIAYKEIFEGQYSEDFNTFADYTDLKINGKIYRIVNVYLQPFKFEKSMVKLEPDNYDDERKVKNIVKKLIPTFKKHQELIDTIRQYIDNSPYPIILAGDFNAVPNSYEYFHLGKDLQDAFVKTGRGSATSFHDYKYPLRLDYIFTSEPVEPISYVVNRSVNLSDHYPVVATFKISQ